MSEYREGIPAITAKFYADNVNEAKTIKDFNSCMDEIEKQATKGEYQCSVYTFVDNKVVEKLEELGYKVDREQGGHSGGDTTRIKWKTPIKTK